MLKANGINTVWAAAVCWHINTGICLLCPDTEEKMGRMQRFALTWRTSFTGPHVLFEYYTQCWRWWIVFRGAQRQWPMARNTTYDDFRARAHIIPYPSSLSARMFACINMKRPASARHTYSPCGCDSIYCLSAWIQSVCEWHVVVTWCLVCTNKTNRSAPLPPSTVRRSAKRVCLTTSSAQKTPWRRSLISSLCWIAKTCTLPSVRSALFCHCAASLMNLARLNVRHSLVGEWL